MSAQERLARLLYAEGAYCGECEFSGWDDCLGCESVTKMYAAAILDSDVIREVRSEAWDECVAAYTRYWSEVDHGHEAEVPPNPYLPTCHPRGVEK